MEEVSNEQKRDRIDELLNEKDMTLEYDHIFDRWLFTLYDRRAAIVWKRKGMSLEALRDELLTFLENYTDSPTTD
ncbi:MAG: hypothetical protein IJ588_02450 [Prevotella sp.]|nr:hypothetical protein [Prevotella sp.]